MPEVSPVSNTPKVVTRPRINWVRVIIASVVGFLLIDLAVGLFAANYKQSTSPTNVTTKKATPSAKPAAPSDQKNETVGWKIYQNDELKFSLKYPSDWNIGPREVQSADPGILLKGSEGYIDIAWTTQFGGGGCSQDEEIQTKSQILKACHGVNTDNSEYWTLFGWASGSPQFTLVYADAKAYAPHETNRVVVLKILSTLEVPTSSSQ